MKVGNETIKLSNSNDELIKCLTKCIEQLDITLKPLTSNTKSLTVIAEISNIDKIRSTFEEHGPQINKINFQFKQQPKLGITILDQPILTFNMKKEIISSNQNKMVMASMNGT